MRRSLIAIEDLHWQDATSERNNSSLSTCHNSVQRKTIIVDDKGYMCGRVDVCLLSDTCILAVIILAAAACTNTACPVVYNLSSNLCSGVSWLRLVTHSRLCITLCLVAHQ
jgi:hypothetical protein